MTELESIGDELRRRGFTDRTHRAVVFAVAFAGSMPPEVFQALTDGKQPGELATAIACREECKRLLETHNYRVQVAPDTAGMPWEGGR